MKLPDEVKVGPFTYRIERPEKVEREGRNLWGEIRYDEGVIRIQANTPEDRAVAIFWHEIIHALDDAVGTGLSEKQITRLGVMLAAFIGDNPHIFRETLDKPAIVQWFESAAQEIESK